MSHPLDSSRYLMNNLPAPRPNERGPFLTFETQEHTSDGGWTGIYTNVQQLRERLIEELLENFRRMHEEEEVTVPSTTTIEELITQYYLTHSNRDNYGTIGAGIMMIMELVHGSSVPMIWKNPNCGGAQVIREPRRCAPAPALPKMTPDKSPARS